MDEEIYQMIPECVELIEMIIESERNQSNISRYIKLSIDGTIFNLLIFNNCRMIVVSK